MEELTKEQYIIEKLSRENAALRITIASQEFDIAVLSSKIDSLSNKDETAE